MTKRPLQGVADRGRLYRHDRQRRKRDILYRSLLDEGFTAGDMARVHSP
jgi:hypothetical protein